MTADELAAVFVVRFAASGFELSPPAITIVPAGERWGFTASFVVQRFLTVKETKEVSTRDDLYSWVNDLAADICGVEGR